MKKTKILLPAMGLIAFATAASVVGSVAWFTASQAYQMTAGEFAVVNTKDNLRAELTAGIGTSHVADTKVITVKDGFQLTDSSLDHLMLNDNVIVEPDANGEHVAQTKAINSSLTEANLLREAAAGASQGEGIYSAFTWDITFKLSFSSTQTKNVGLYLDLSKDTTYMHEAYKATAADAASTPTGDWFEDEACTTALTGNMSEGVTYYKEAPNSTGEGFRVAFIPKTIPTGSLGLAKVWAEHNSEAMKYIDLANVKDFDAAEDYAIGTVVKYTDGKYYKAKVAGVHAWDAGNWELALLDDLDVAYGAKTTQLVGSTRSEVTAAAGKVAMAKGDTTGIPNSEQAKADALAGNSNYLGFFGASSKDESNTVALTYTCVAYYEGTDPKIVNNDSTIYETMVLGMEFGVKNLSD